MLYIDGRVVRLETLPGRSFLKAQELEQARPLAVFFDDSGRAKAYWRREDDNFGMLGFDLWDMESGQRNWSNNDEEAESRGPCGPYSWVWIIAGTETSLQVGFQSLVDQRLIGSHTFDRGEYEDVRSIVPGLSPSNHYFLYQYQHSGWAKHLTEWVSSSGWLGDTIESAEDYLPILRPRIVWHLEDFSNGKNVDLKGLEHSEADLRWDDNELRAINAVFLPADFFDSKSGFYTLDDRGVHVWDLPPKMRWFTPWAWAALAATLALGVGLWKSRSRSLHAAEAPPISLAS